MEKVSVLQQDLQQLKRELLCPKQVAKRLQGLKKVIATGSLELRYIMITWGTVGMNILTDIQLSSVIMLMWFHLTAE